MRKMYIYVMQMEQLKIQEADPIIRDLSLKPSRDS
jgi:hypothetical protein